MDARSAHCTTSSASCHSYSRPTAVSVASKIPEAASSAQHSLHAGRKLHLGNPSQLVLPVSCTTGYRGLTRGSSACSGSGQSCASTHGSAAGFWARHQGHISRGATITSRATRDDHSSAKVMPTNQHDSPDQPSPAGLEPTTSSSNRGKGQVMTSIQGPSLQQQQPVSGTPAPANPWTAPLAILAVLFGMLTLSDALKLLLRFALPRLRTLLADASPARIAAASSLTGQLLFLSLTAGSLALLCCLRRTTVAAFLRLNVKEPRETMREGWEEGCVALGMAAHACLFVSLVTSIATLVWVGCQLCSATGSMALQLTVLRSGDPLAVLMLGVSNVVLAPVAEELFFRAIALQCLVNSYPVLTPVMLVLTSVWFGAAHLSHSLESKALAVASGLCWGYKYLAAGRNILVPICAHALTNLFITTRIAVAGW